MSEILKRMPELSKGLWSYTDEWDSVETNALVTEMFLNETQIEPDLQVHEGVSANKLTQPVSKSRVKVERRKR